MMCRFEAYGVSVNYPSQWRIYIPQRQSFCQEDGTLKFDDVAGTDSRASLTLSWEQAGPIEGFAANYLESAEKNYQKKVKGRCQILKKKLIHTHGHEAGFLHARLSSSTHAFKIMGKSLELEVMQLAYYCADSGRIMMGTIIAEHTYFVKNMNCLKEMLLSIQSSETDGGSERREAHAYSEISCAV